MDRESQGKWNNSGSSERMTIKLVCVTVYVARFTWKGGRVCGCDTNSGISSQAEVLGCHKIYQLKVTVNIWLRVYQKGYNKILTTDMCLLPKLSINHQLPHTLIGDGKTVSLTFFVPSRCCISVWSLATFAFSLSRLCCNVPRHSLSIFRSVSSASLYT